MPILVDIVHPADVHFFKHAIHERAKKGHYVVVIGSRGELRFCVCDHADRPTGANLSAESVPRQSASLCTNEWQSYHDNHPAPATVCHGIREWARDDDHDGVREVHCNTYEGAGAALRIYLHALRCVHKQYLYLSVATYEAMVNAKRIASHLIRRMCVGA